MEIDGYNSHTSTTNAAWTGSTIPLHDHPLPLMERERLLEHLSAAKRYVEEGNLQIATQKCVIIDLKAADRSTTEAENLLWWFELDQQGNLAAVERILDALDDGGYALP